MALRESRFAANTTSDYLLLKQILSYLCLPWQACEFRSAVRQDVDRVWNKNSCIMNCTLCKFVNSENNNLSQWYLMWHFLLNSTSAQCSKRIFLMVEMAKARVHCACVVAHMPVCLGTQASSVNQYQLFDKVILFITLPNPHNCSKHFTLYFLGRPLQSNTISTSQGSIQLCCN